MSRRTDAARQRGLRRILLIASAPVVLFALVVVIWLLRPGIVLGGALDAFERGQFAESESSAGELVDQFIVEPWIPYFDRGDALVAQGEYIDAIDDFEKALELAPQDRRCMVRGNLARSWEALADQYEEAGFHEGAAQLYEAAKQVIADGAKECSGDDGLSGLGEELEQKQQQAEQNSDGEGTDGGSESDQDKLDELGQKDREGAQERGESDSRDGGDGTGGGGTDRPW
jgi:tetratricopeptide (TPR) repeat protein